MSDKSRARGGRWRRLILLLAILAPALFIASAGLSVIGHDPRLLWYQHQTVDTLRATDARTYSVPSQLSPFDKTVKDAAAVQALYRAAFDQPTPMFGLRNCALGLPVVYHLVFSRAGQTVATIDLDLTGCGSLSLAGLATRTLTTSFLQQVADTLHVSEESLWQPLVLRPGPTIPQMTLTVERIGETPTTRFTPLSKMISDANTAFMLDNALVRYSTYSGLPVPPPASACPPNDGVLYRLTFYENGAHVASKDVEATGCQLIFTHDGFPPEHISDSAFWRLLAQALGVPLASLGVGPTTA